MSADWKFVLETEKIGFESKWYKTDLTDDFRLPGSNDLGYLSREFLHVSGKLQLFLFSAMAHPIKI